MIISRTPFRISFAGGGSDLREYYQNYGGAVLSVTIDKYVYLSMHPYFNEKKIFLKYSSNELVDTVDQIQHRIIKQVFSNLNISGVDLNSSADIPAGTGLASSSAFTSGLLNLTYAYLGKFISREAIAKMACDIEIEQLKEPIGKQDQYACAIGGLNFIEFRENEQVVVNKVKLGAGNQSKLQNNLLMFYLGNTRSASSILSEQRKNIISGADKNNNLHKMVQLAYDLQKELQAGQVDAIGEILHTGWKYKKELASQISNPQIDHYYDLALKAGAVGGKLLGAGGGGFLLFYVPEQSHESVRVALQELAELPFQFDFSGSSIVFADEQFPRS
ncbi:D-glycero-alpha-D-manno-heptose-7-phosphate kinase [Dyadobacter jejuensis]|uniref:D-glycero-alpha-D-manno-heptose-7-phosphate kinase n=1 Tax=Dyadobacter jejuensis TaxID=1082580 RepID=A0A316BD33_9BACT|nr:GHMP kinase [Dyadobacter jejuensis]PWJ60387.1 D-glycero-alpha-D-manno-heptose-7-phosphate kinase [Dyadobacter jejuensis]